MVDVSHASRQTMMDAVAASAAPVIASHSGAAGENANVRNLDDEQLRAIAASGGVAQIVAYAPYLRPQPAEKTAAIEALRAELGLADAAARAAAPAETIAEYQRRMARLNAEYPGADVGDLVDHIDHAVSVAGIDHVGIASDFEGGGGVAGWRDASETFNVTLELARRRYSDADIEKLWGGNILRVLDAVQAAAAP
jgi:membrane dipeptidase